MIRINLLPVEKRKLERTPLPRLFLIMVAAGVATVILVIIVMSFIQIGNVTSEIEDKQATLTKLAPQLAQFDKETARKTQLTSKRKEITDVSNHAIEWWRAINAVWDVINNNPKIWVDDVRAVDAKSTQSEYKRLYPEAKEYPPYSLILKCHAAGYEVSDMTRFRNALKEHPVLAQILPTVNFSVEWRVEDEKDYDERFSMAFTVTMFGPTGKPAAPPAPAAASAPKAGGTP